MAQGNRALRNKECESAIRFYIQALQATPALADTISGNIELARKRYQSGREGQPRQRVAVCGWELAHNAAGRVYTLAKLYETFADVEIIGSIFPKYGREVWEPIRNTAIPRHTFVVDDPSQFIEQAINLVTAHPYDIVHLSKPRAPNIFFGILYKLIWGATVLVDIDDEELAFVDAESPLDLAGYLKRHGTLPDMSNLAGKEWTQIAVGLAKEFDGVTVSNPALQQRYGGEIIRHARDIDKRQSYLERRTNSRKIFGVDAETKVVLFFGTPRRHKGLLQTADAISALDRKDVAFIIVGTFLEAALKGELLAKDNVDYRFIDNQPYDTIMDIVALGDVAVFFQDAQSLAAQFQTPAKLTDALAMGLTILAAPTPGIQDILVHDLVRVVNQDNLVRELEKALAEPCANEARESRHRQLFDAEFSSAANVPRIQKALAHADHLVTSAIVVGELSVLCEKMGGPIFSLGSVLQKSKPTISQAAPISSTMSAVAPTSASAPSSHRMMPSPSAEKIQKLEEILATKLCDGPQRFFKLFDFDLETNFLAALFKQKNTSVPNAANVRVSIVMPTHNRAKVIEQALASVLGQTHKNWELFVVDDGSTDDTSGVLRRYANETRIKVVQGEHGGVSAARNKGLQLVSGDYIFYLDSDNTWTPHYLQTMIMMFLYSGKKTGYCATTLIDDTQKVIGYRGEPFDWEHCLDANYVDLNVFAHERALIQECGAFDETLRRMVDWDVILRYTKQHPPFYAPFIGCSYFESKSDQNRITVSEPLAFQKVVRLRNSIGKTSASKVSKLLCLNFAIKIPAPYEQRHQWGDFHYADSLRIALENMGHSVVLDFHGQWYKRPANRDDVVIAIRGLTAYKPARGQINILWNISHPDQVSFEEYESFDQVYVASLSYASFLGTFLKARVKPLLQCSDPSRFYFRELKTTKPDRILFVGNSRNEYRPIVKKAIEAGQDIEIYGTLWHQFVQGEYVVGENIPNDELREYYASYGVVLNDHWESMRVFGFVSNRIFDVLAAGGTLISDSLPSISRLFGDAVCEIDDDEDFGQALVRMRARESSETQKRNISDYICKYHSFGRRAGVINDGVLERLGLPPVDANKEEIGLFGQEPRSRPKVGLLLQSGPVHPTSSAYIRLIAPLTTELAHAQLDIVLLDGVQDSKLLECAAIIVQRVAIPDRASADQLLSAARQHEIALYVDIDDAFAELPDTHPEKDHYQRMDQILRHVMEGADHVWFSTEALARLYRKDYRSGSVVSNTLDPRLWRNYRKPRPRAALTPKFHILFMGTATHDADFAVVLPALDALVQAKGACFDVTIIGALRHPPQREWLKVIKPPKGNTSYPYFVRWLVNSGSYDIGIAPLVDDVFNGCKSDIKFLDYSALGIPTLCSRNNAYHAVAEAGLVLSCENTTEQWLRALTTAMETPELMLNMVSRSWDYLWGQRTAETSAPQLLNYLAPSHQPTERYQIDLPVMTPGSRNRVAVCIHLYYIHRWAVIRPYLDSVPVDFDLYVTCQQEQRDAVSALVHKDFPSAVLVSTPNQGMDVLPFLRLNYEYALWRYDAVLKLHTKNDQTQDDDTLGRLCLDALLGSKKLVAGILHELLSGNRVGMVGPEILYRSATKLMYANGNQVRQLLVTLGMQYPNEDWGFFAGTMFWIHGGLLRNLALQFQRLSALESQDPGGSTTAGDGAWAHAMERVFGAMPFLNHMEIAVTYPHTSRGQHLLRRINKGEIEKNAAFRNGSRAHLRRYRSLQSWHGICKQSGLFDSQYYVAQAGAMIPSQMDPVVHLILYADDLLLDPSRKFSTSSYKKHNGDVVKAGIPTLVHYLTNGKKEGRRTCTADGVPISQ